MYHVCSFPKFNICIWEWSPLFNGFLFRSIHCQCQHRLGSSRTNFEMVFSWLMGKEQVSCHYHLVTGSEGPHQQWDQPRSLGWIQYQFWKRTQLVNVNVGYCYDHLLKTPQLVRLLSHGRKLAWTARTWMNSIGSNEQVVATWEEVWGVATLLFWLWMLLWV